MKKVIEDKQSEINNLRDALRKAENELCKLEQGQFLESSKLSIGEDVYYENKKHQFAGFRRDRFGWEIVLLCYKKDGSLGIKERYVVKYWLSDIKKINKNESPAKN